MMAKVSFFYTMFKTLDIIPAPVFLINDQEKIIYINNKFKAEIGDALGTKYPPSIFNMKKLNKDSKDFIITKNGVVYSLDITHYRAINKQIIRLGILKDVTEWKKIKDYTKYLEDLNKDMDRIYRKQKKVIAKLTQQALTDSLTGLYNQRHFWKQVGIELKRAYRYSEPLSCIMIDIDNFKLVNDCFNHQFGDTVLKKIANLIRTPLRATDILARYGGDEFVALLPNTDYEGSEVISNKILRRIRQSIFETKGLCTSVTISLGVSSYPIDQISDSSELVKYADAALYDAKTKGKDRVSFFHDLKLIALN